MLRLLRLQSRRKGISAWENRLLAQEMPKSERGFLLRIDANLARNLRTSASSAGDHPVARGASVVGIPCNKKEGALEKIVGLKSWAAIKLASRTTSKGIIGETLLVLFIGVINEPASSGATNGGAKPSPEEIHLSGVEPVLSRRLNSAASISSISLRKSMSYVPSSSTNGSAMTTLAPPDEVLTSSRTRESARPSPF